MVAVKYTLFFIQQCKWTTRTLKDFLSFSFLSFSFLILLFLIKQSSLGSYPQNKKILNYIVICLCSSRWVQPYLLDHVFLKEIITWLSFIFPFDCVFLYVFIMWQNPLMVYWMSLLTSYRRLSASTCSYEHTMDESNSLFLVLLRSLSLSLSLFLFIFSLSSIFLMHF